MSVGREQSGRDLRGGVEAIGTIAMARARLLSRRGTVGARRALSRALMRAQRRIDPDPTAIAAEPAVVSEPSHPVQPVHQIDLGYSVRLAGRYGFGLPVHPELDDLLTAGRNRYRIPLEGILGLREHLLRISVSAPTGDGASPAAAPEPRWINGFLPGLDSAAIYEALVRLNPAVYMEVGSGFSTMFARRAIRDHGLRTRIVSLDPQPRADIDTICDQVIRTPLEDADLGIFDQLGDGDILFVDGSHICHPNADVTVVFLEILPRLPRGVHVQIHDVYLPADYHPTQLDRFYSEQYLLAVQLLSGGMGYQVTLPCYFTFLDPELSAVLRPLWSDPRMDGVEPHGCSFWLVRSP